MDDDLTHLQMMMLPSIMSAFSAPVWEHDRALEACDTLEKLPDLSGPERGCIDFVRRTYTPALDIHLRCIWQNRHSELMAKGLA